MSLFCARLRLFVNPADRQALRLMLVAKAFICNPVYKYSEMVQKVKLAPNERDELKTRLIIFYFWNFSFTSLYRLS